LGSPHHIDGQLPVDPRAFGHQQASENANICTARLMFDGELEHHP